MSFRIGGIGPVSPELDGLRGEPCTSQGTISKGVSVSRGWVGLDWLLRPGTKTCPIVTHERCLQRGMNEQVS